MKTYQLITALVLLFLSACSGSDVYQGDWKATSTDGEEFDIHFDPNSFTVRDVNGETETFDYNQNSVEISNGDRTYGIILSDGPMYYIYFDGGDISQGVILTENDQVVYNIRRVEVL